MNHRKCWLTAVRVDGVGLKESHSQVVQHGGFVQVAERREVILPHQDVRVTQERKRVTLWSHGVLQRLKRDQYAIKTQSIRRHTDSDCPTDTEAWQRRYPLSPDSLRPCRLSCYRCVTDTQQDKHQHLDRNQKLRLCLKPSTTSWCDIRTWGKNDVDGNFKKYFWKKNTTLLIGFKKQI